METHDVAPPRPGGRAGRPTVLCVTSGAQDVAGTFAPSLRWFASVGFRVHVLCLDAADAPGDAPVSDDALGLRPECVIRLRLRPGSLDRARRPILDGLLARAVRVSGCSALLTYGTTDDAGRRVVRSAVRRAGESGGVATWMPAPDVVDRPSDVSPRDFVPAPRRPVRRGPRRRTSSARRPVSREAAA